MKVVVHVTTAGKLVADKADARSAGSVAVAEGEGLVLQLHGSPSSVLFSSRVALRVFSKEQHWCYGLRQVKTTGDGRCDRHGGPAS